MKPVIIGDATLYCGDCMDIFPLIGKVDAVITDPPYGIGLKVKTRSTKQNDAYSGGQFKTDFSAIHGDDYEFDPTFLLGYPCILWGANNYARYLPASNGWLVWYKCGGIKGFAMSECEMAWSNILSSTRHFDHLWHGFKRASENGKKVEHPTQKPIALMAWCIQHAASAETILDPFMGSGTTGVAAIQLGRKFIGIERDPAYFEIACRRIELAVSQGQLFAPEPMKQVQESLL
jgi:DNA modification methylase